MRPLIVDLGREDRGGQHQAFLLLQGLRERGHAPELIAVRDSLLASRAKDLGVPVHAVGLGWRRLAAALQIRQLVREKRIDIIHANEPHALSSAWLARAHHFVPMVVSRRIALPLSPSPFSMARYRAVARVVAVSHFVAQSVIQSGIAADRVTMIYDGVRISTEISRDEQDDARDQLGIPREIPCIGNVAAFVPEKGHALLLNALAKLRVQFPECKLLLRGDGPEFSNLQMLARKLHLLDAIKFLPPAIQIERVFAAIDVFAFPSHEEPLGSALLAAMAHGLPVAAIARGGIPEVLKDGKNGLLAGDLNPDALASAIARLLANPNEARRLGKAARETVATIFSADRMVEETLRLYEQLVAAGSAPVPRG